MFSLIPIYAVSNGLSVFVPIYILYLGGNVLQVGTALMLYNLVSIPAALVFGRLTDKTHNAKLFVVFSVVATLPILLLFFFYRGILQTYLYYSLYAIVFTAALPSINLLVLQTRPNRTLPKNFSRYSIFGTLGALFAFLLGILTGEANPIFYLYLIIAFCMLSVPMVILLISHHKGQRGSSHNKSASAKHLIPLLSMLFQVHMPQPGLRFLEHMRSGSKSRPGRGVLALLSAIALFNLSYYIFYASYIPYQRSAGMPYNEIFIVQFVNIIVQISVFAALILVVRMDMQKYALSSTSIRGLSYIAVLLSMFMPLSLFYGMNLLAYGLIGLSSALWSVSSTVMLYNRIRGKRYGYYIGVWTGMLGGSAAFGSMLSGVLSTAYGYVPTFAVAVLAVATSGAVFSLWVSHENVHVRR